jgi:uncharacterized repeat protein (TIGR01451 family)
MKYQRLRLYLLLSWSLLLLLGLLSGGVTEPDPAAAYSPPNAGEAAPLNADVENWVVNEIFICANGSEQFVELRNPTPAIDQFEFGEEQIITTNLANTETNIFTFPDGTDLSPPTDFKTLLVATDGFSSLPGGVTPDFILPDNFLFSGGGMVRFEPAALDSVSYGAGQLPSDGLNSLNRQGAGLISGPNSPRNYAGQTGSVSCPPPPPPAPNLTLTKTADSAGIVEAGVVLSYTITVGNSGNAAATNAQITDTVPISTTYVPNSASDGGIFSNGVISWPPLTINPATNLIRTFRVTVSATVTTGNKITNTARITSTQGVSATGSNVVTVGSVASRKTYLPIIFKNN